MGLSGPSPVPDVGDMAMASAKSLWRKVRSGSLTSSSDPPKRLMAPNANTPSSPRRGLIRPVRRNTAPASSISPPESPSISARLDSVREEKRASSPSEKASGGQSLVFDAWTHGRSPKRSQAIRDSSALVDSPGSVGENDADSDTETNGQDVSQVMFVPELIFSFPRHRRPDAWTLNDSLHLGKRIGRSLVSTSCQSIRILLGTLGCNTAHDVCDISLRTAVIAVSSFVVSKLAVMCMISSILTDMPTEMQVAVTRSHVRAPSIQLCSSVDDCLFEALPGNPCGPKTSDLLADFLSPNAGLHTIQSTRIKRAPSQYDDPCQPSDDMKVCQ